MPEWPTWPPCRNCSRSRSTTRLKSRGTLHGCFAKLCAYIIPAERHGTVSATVLTPRLISTTFMPTCRSLLIRTLIPAVVAWQSIHFARGSAYGRERAHGCLGETPMRSACIALVLFVGIGLTSCGSDSRGRGEGAASRQAGRDAYRASQ